jgi:hypothetical protein
MATATGTVRDGGLSQSRADPSQSQVTTDLASVQQTATITARLKGTVVAQSVNKPMVPGATWGWAPAPLGGLAFVDAKKRLVLIDRAGKTLDVAGTTDVMLPAWSQDGKRIAFLQRKGRKNFVLSVVELEAR